MPHSPAKSTCTQKLFLWYPSIHLQESANSKFKPLKDLDLDLVSTLGCVTLDRPTSLCLFPHLENGGGNFCPSRLHPNVMLSACVRGDKHKGSGAHLERKRCLFSPPIHPRPSHNLLGDGSHRKGNWSDARRQLSTLLSVGFVHGSLACRRVFTGLGLGSFLPLGRSKSE